jgi:hypothetical protein
MKTLPLTSITALLIATGTVRAAEQIKDTDPIAVEQCDACTKNGKLDPACVRKLDYHGGEIERTIITIKQCKERIADPGVRWDCRHGFVFYAENLDGEKAATFIVKTRNSRLYKACAAYQRCLDDRDAGKVKHCYENDKRWRNFLSGWW